jgi:UPF0271 protein
MCAIDFNSDLGEGLTTDAAVMESVTSANIACGAHAGDDQTMARTIALAVERGIAVGAHPGYPDRENFGRMPLVMDDDALAQSVAQQIERLVAVAVPAGARVRHVKAHGALYNQGERDDHIAGVIASAVGGYDRRLVLVCTPMSAMARAAARIGLRVAREGFCDRRYEPDGTLRPRSKEGALITDPLDASTQALALAARGDIDTVCVHGDTPGAAVIARRVRAVLEDAGYELKPFA